MASKKGDVVHAAFEKAGARLSRKVSFVRRSNDVVTMTNVEQVNDALQLRSFAVHVKIFAHPLQTFRTPPGRVLPSRVLRG